MKTRLELLTKDFQPQILHKIIDYEIKIKDLARRLLALNINEKRGVINVEIDKLKQSLKTLYGILDIILQMIKEEEENE